MGVDLSCEWMSLKIKSPLVVASLTPLSNARIKEHIAFFETAVSHGAGAVILPSINPERHGAPEINEERVEAYVIDAGLSNNDHMAFSVLGPTVPNIVSVEYGLSLAGAAKRKFPDIPVIASVVNLGSAEQIQDVMRQFSDLQVDGFEMNFSCPNVDTRNGDVRYSIPEILTKLRKITGKPISLKLTPYQDYSLILNDLKGSIDGLTLSNAYLGLIPPLIDHEHFSPFETADVWAPGGIYGPFERPLTFYKLFQIRKAAEELNVDIACAGGIVSGTDAVQAILLGTSAIEISSGLQWKSSAVFKDMNNSIKEYLSQSGQRSIADIKGSALEKIQESADHVLPVMKKRRSVVNPVKCKGCKDCTCIDRLCFAISKGKNGKAAIDCELCSGCGWCVKMCRFGAISFKYDEDSSRFNG